MASPKSNSGQNTCLAPGEILPKHSQMAYENVVDLSDWLNRQLADLEERFAHFETPNSRHKSIRQGR